MSRSVNKVILIGNLGKDAEVSFTPSGVCVNKFSIATTRRYKSGEEWKEETDWHNIVLWRNEGIGQYLTKGKQVYVEGRIHNRSYEKDGTKRYITEIVADEVQLLGGGDTGARTSHSSVSDGARAAMATAIPDDDVPF